MMVFPPSPGGKHCASPSAVFFRPNTDYEASAAQDSMQALRDAIKKAPPQRAQFQKLLTALDANISMTSAFSIAEADKLKMLEQIVKLIPDLRTQWEFHLESSKADRSYAVLRQCIKDIVGQGFGGETAASSRGGLFKATRWQGIWSQRTYCKRSTAAEARAEGQGEQRTGRR